MAWFFTECSQKEIRFKNRPEFLPFFHCSPPIATWNIPARKKGSSHDSTSAVDLTWSTNSWLSTHSGYTIPRSRGTVYQQITDYQTIIPHTATYCPIIGKPIPGQRKRAQLKVEQKVRFYMKPEDHDKAWRQAKHYKVSIMKKQIPQKPWCNWTWGPEHP